MYQRASGKMASYSTCGGRKKHAISLLLDAAFQYLARTTQLSTRAPFHGKLQWFFRPANFKDLRAAHSPHPNRRQCKLTSCALANLGIHSLSPCLSCSFPEEVEKKKGASSMLFCEALAGKFERTLWIHLARFCGTAGSSTGKFLGDFSRFNSTNCSQTRWIEW